MGTGQINWKYCLCFSAPLIYLYNQQKHFQNMLFLYSYTFFLFLGKRIFHSSILFVIRICGLSSMTLTMTLETSAAKTPLVLQSVDLDRLALSFTWHHHHHHHHHQIHRQYRVQARTGTIYSFFLSIISLGFFFSRQCRLFCWFFSLLSVNCHSSSQSMSPLTIISEGHCRSGHQKRLSIITITMITITITITTVTVTMAIKRQISLSPSPW